MTILISRTDRIGDVIHTIPLIRILKKEFPDCRVIFLGRTYTKPILNCIPEIDEILEWDTIKSLPKSAQIELFKNQNISAALHVFPEPQIAKILFHAQIPLRIGTSHRFYHWIYCNKLISFSRKSSHLHEAQLNLKLLRAFTLKTDYSIEKLSQLYSLTPEFSTEKYKNYIIPQKTNIILHPKSGGSAREWPAENYFKLCELLDVQKYHIIFTGTQEEGNRFSQASNFYKSEHIRFAFGDFTLEEYLGLLANTDVFVSASTGPLHIAAALDRITIGLYPPIRPMHPGRWAPLGKNAVFLCLDKECSSCRKTNTCKCLEEISPESVANKIAEMCQNNPALR